MSDQLLVTLKMWADQAALSPFSCITITLSELRKIIAHEEASAVSLPALQAELASVMAERDELICYKPTDAPAGERFLLNAYGRRCYSAGRESADADLTALRAALQTRPVMLGWRIAEKIAEWSRNDLTDVEFVRKSDVLALLAVPPASTETR